MSSARYLTPTQPCLKTINSQLSQYRTSPNHASSIDHLAGARHLPMYAFSRFASVLFTTGAYRAHSCSHSPQPTSRGARPPSPSLPSPQAGWTPRSGGRSRAGIGARLPTTWPRPSSRCSSTPAPARAKCSPQAILPAWTHDCEPARQAVEAAAQPRLVLLLQVRLQADLPVRSL